MHIATNVIINLTSSGKVRQQEGREQKSFMYKNSITLIEGNREILSQ